MGIYIDNFSVPNNQDIFFVDLVSFSAEIKDTTSVVTSSGLGVYINNEPVLFSKATISGGYKLTYITKVTRSLNIMYSGINLLGDSVTKTYKIKYGCKVTYNKVMLYNPKETESIFVKVDNNVLVKNTYYFSTFFVTKQYMSSNLGATVYADGSGFIDLYVDVTPRSTWFFYGKTYKLIISGISDFAGNLLPTREVFFTIENKKQ